MLKASTPGPAGATGSFLAHLRRLSVRADRVRPRNVLGIKDARTAPRIIPARRTIDHLSGGVRQCRIAPLKIAPGLSGAIPEIRLRPGSYLQSLLFAGHCRAEEFFCNFSK